MFIAWITTFIRELGRRSAHRNRQINCSRAGREIASLPPHLRDDLGWPLHRMKGSRHIIK